MNNLLIIGNGFDLAHDLKTSYNDFVNHIVDSHLENRELYNDLFNVIPSITSRSQLNDHLKKNISSPYINFKNKFFQILLFDFALYNWCDIEKKYYTLLIQEKRYGDIRTFHQVFEVIKSHLSDYLCSLNTHSVTHESYNYLFSKLINHNSYLLNFNYTSTLKNYYNLNNVLSEKQVINIHGELKDSENPMIFGFAANDAESRKLINKDDKEYMRYIKKHCYKRTNNELNLRFFLDNNKKINVLVLGHSCGISDKLILNQIFNHTNINSITIFYYEEYEKYFETQVNIDRIMNSDINFKKLKSFQSSFRMPQIQDSKELCVSFKDFINRLVENYKVYRMSDPGDY